MFEKSFNATFIALIPKKVRAIQLNDFRPISLIGSVYKIIAKLLAERLKNVIHRLVDGHKMAFIKGRQIMDAILIANECVEATQRSNNPGILCKLDIQKAYDHLNLEYLLGMLQKMGFDNKWIRWVKFCITTVKFSILVNNNSPTGFFSSQKGMRQGDPLPPFLFILAMEGMNDMLQTVEYKGWIKGLEVSPTIENTKVITHLQYADDTLIFCDANRDQLRYLRIIFIIFEEVSGLQINWGKSYIYPVNTVTEIQLLADILGGKVGELPTIYLGMPL